MLNQIPKQEISSKIHSDLLLILTIQLMELILVLKKFHHYVLKVMIMNIRINH